MNTKDGYAKKSLTSARLLTADGGDTDNYLPLTGGTMTGALVTTALSVSGAATFSLAINGSILGNAATASRLLNARTISLTGRVTGSASFDGSSNISIDSTVARARFGDSSNEEHNCNNITMNGMWYYSSNGPSNLGEQSTDGALYSQAYSTSWVAQIALDYRDGRLYVRSKNNGVWKKWYAVALGGDEFNLRNNVNFDPSTLTFRFSASGNIDSRKLYRNCLLRFKLTALTTIHAELTNNPGVTDPVVRWEFNGSNAYAQKVHSTVTGGSTTYAAGDYFSIEIIGTTAYFYKNDSLVTSTTITPDHVKAYFWGGSAELTIAQVTYLPLPNTQTAGSGGGGGGASYLTQLSDVNISGAASGLYLKYNGSSWVNSSISLGLGDLSNVSISSPTNGLVLKYNGTSWVNGTDNTGSGGASMATSWAETGTGTLGTSSPTLSIKKAIVAGGAFAADAPQALYYPGNDTYYALPVIIDSDGLLFVAISPKLANLVSKDKWSSIAPK